MRRKLLAMVLTIALLVGILPASLAMADNEPNLMLVDGYYEIGSVDDWNILSDFVAAGNNCAGLKFKLTDNIGTITQPIGKQVGNNKNTDRMRFAGEFEGNGKTINIDLDGSSDWFNYNKGYCSPFAYTDAVTIRNLHVTGSVTAYGQWASGLIGSGNGKSIVENCTISVAITSNYNHANTTNYANHGGVIGIAEGGSEITDTVFNGRFLGTDYSYSGGFIGLNKGPSTFEGCVFAPEEIGEGVMADHACIFAHNNGAAADVVFEGDENYYTEVFGNGNENNQVENTVTQAYSVKIASDIANGTVSKSTSETIFHGNEEITLQFSPAEGYELSGMLCIREDDSSDIVLTENQDGTFTFTMPTSNVVVSADFTKIPEPAFVDEISLVLAGKIGVVFSMYLPDLENMEYDASYMTFADTANDTVFQIISPDEGGRLYLPAENGSYDGEGRTYKFTCYTNSIQMAQPIQATFHYPIPGEDGNVTWKTVSKTATFSIEQYFSSFDKVADYYSSATVDLVHALADYGYYVQPLLASVHDWEFGYDYVRLQKHYTEAYDFEAVQRELFDNGINGLQLSNQSEGDIQKVTYSLLLDTGTSIRVYFKMADGYGADQKFEVSCDHTSIEVGRSGNRWYVEIPNIYAQNLDKEYTINVTTQNGTATITASALSYAVDALAAYTDANDSEMMNRNAVSALYYYWEAARAYLLDKHN